MKFKAIGKAMALMLGVSLAITPVCATETTKPVLEIQKAIDMAIGKDDTIGQYSRNIEVYKEQQTGISDISSLNYNTKKIEIEETEQKKVYRKDVLTKEVTDAYQNMVLLQKNMDLLEEQINLGEKQVKQIQIKKEKGYSDELTYEKAVQNLENTKVSLEQVEKNLEDAKKSFLQLTNLNVDNYTLELDATYEPLVLDKDITAYATGMANQLVKYMNQKVELNEENFWDTIYQSGPEGGGPTYATYLEQKVSMQNAKDNAKSAYDTYKLLIQTKYTALNAQLDTVKTKMNAYNTALKDMRVLEIKYKAGYVSAIDYETQKTQLDALEVDYLKEVFGYNSLKGQIEKPWTMSEYSF
nr:TolC family protein [uncultured Cellulosilyticum sp.]